jgi:hypothetical protein
MESKEVSTRMPSDVVNYSSTPSAPLIIPIIFFTVIGIAIICCIIKLLRSLWDRKRKSDTYVFVDATDEESKLHYTIESNSSGKLIPLTYITVRKRESNGNINEIYDNNCSSLRVEANVHQMSQHMNETNDEESTHARDDKPLNPKNTIIATESDV